MAYATRVVPPKQSNPRKKASGGVLWPRDNQEPSSSLWAAPAPPLRVHSAPTPVAHTSTTNSNNKKVMGPSRIPLRQYTCHVTAVKKSLKRYRGSQVPGVAHGAQYRQQVQKNFGTEEVSYMPCIHTPNKCQRSTASSTRVVAFNDAQG